MKKLVFLLTFVGLVGFANAQWQQTSLDTTIVYALAIRGNSIFAGTNDGVYLSTNNGTNWTWVNNGSSIYNVLSLAINGDTIFAGTKNRGVFCSTNNANSWNEMNTGLTDTTIHSLAIIGNNIFAGTDGSGVFLSSNNGQFWTAVNSGLYSPNIYSLATNGSNIYAATMGVFSSSNNGSSWTDLGFDTRIFTAIATSGNNFFAGDVGGLVYFVSNNGANWTVANNGLPLYATITALLVNGFNIFAANIEGVFLSINNGNNWNNLNYGLTNTDVHCLAINNDYLFAGTDSGGVWKLPLSELGINVLNNNESNIAFYPNPANDNLTIETPQQSTIQIFTIHGQLIKALAVSGNKTNIDHVGYSSYVVDVSALPAGVYIVQVKTEKGVGVRKFVKE